MLAVAGVRGLQTLQPAVLPLVLLNLAGQQEGYKQSKLNNYNI